MRTGPLPRALLARIGVAVATISFATLVVVTLLALAPGDAADLQADPDTVRRVLTTEWGLDRGPLGRWARTWGRLARLDLGTSYTVRPGTPVGELVAVPAQRTLVLVVGAAAAATVAGAGLAGVTAGRSGSWRAWVHAAGAAPIFLLAWASVTAIDAVTWAAIQDGWIARPSWFALPDQEGPVRTALAITVLALGSGAVTRIHAEVEGAVVDLRAAPWMEAARARGEATWPLLLRGLLPAWLGGLSDRVAMLVGGAIVAEKALLVRGAGALLWDAAMLRDHELAASLGLLAAALVAAGRLGADAVRLWADPRARARP